MKRKSPTISTEVAEQRRQQCIERNTTHGMSKLPEYKVWKGMKKRCYNPNDKRYEHYGARGIVVADVWLKDFPAFYEHVGPRPDDGQKWSIGRIDNNGNYEPGNVRWEIDEEQARNHKLQENNKTGFVGIKLRSRVIGKGTYTTYTATVTHPGGKRRSKDFSVDKYGKEQALLLALGWRESQLEYLKTLGVIYAESHGKNG